MITRQHKTPSRLAFLFSAISAIAQGYAAPDGMSRQDVVREHRRALNGIKYRTGNNQRKRRKLIRQNPHLLRSKKYR